MSTELALRISPGSFLESYTADSMEHKVSKENSNKNFTERAIHTVKGHEVEWQDASYQQYLKCVNKYFESRVAVDNKSTKSLLLEFEASERASTNKERKKLYKHIAKTLDVMYHWHRLLKPGCLSKKSSHENYLSFKKHLREAIKILKECLEKDPDNQSLKYASSVLGAISFAIYESVNVYGFSDELMNLLFRGDSRLEKVEEASKVLRKDLSRLSSDNPYTTMGCWPTVKSIFQRIQGNIGLVFDPSWNNFPFYLCSLQILQLDTFKAKEVRLIRMGCPLKQYFHGSTGCIMVNPEFEMYLDFLQKEGKKHLYINKQGKKLGCFEVESLRFKKLKELSEEKDNFVVVSLPDHGKTYKQENIGDINSKYFKIDLYQAMIKNEEGFYFPKEFLQDPYFLIRLSEIINQIHRTYFVERVEGEKVTKRTLNKEEREEFLELLYTELELFLTQYTHADYLNITCKDGKDRAGKELLKLFNYVHALNHPGKPSKDYIKNMRYMTHLATLIVSKNGMKGTDRVRRLANTLDLFDKRMRRRVRRAHKKNPVVVGDMKFPKPLLDQGAYYSPLTYI